MKPFLLTVLLFFVQNYFAQEVETKDCICCTEYHHQFDFWLGEWSVYDTLNNFVGFNKIIKDYENCLVKESWASKGTNSGTSYNYFNPSDSTWNQLWIDNQGTILELKGHLVDNKMILKSTLLKGRRVDWYYNRIIWEPFENNFVKQTWDILDDQNNLLTNLFTGIYKPSQK